MTDGLAEVQSRIAQIQRLFSAPAATGVVPGARASASAGAFATALAGAQADTDGAAVGGTGESTSGAAVVADAKKYLGVPYVWGGTNPAHGLDCSGFVQRVYSDLGVKLPRVSGDQARQGTPVASLNEAQPGDLLAFGHPVHHIGIYVGDGKMINAPHTGTRVRIEKVHPTPSAIRRIFPSDGSVAAASNAGSPAGVTGSSSGGSQVPFAGLFRAAAARHGVPASLLAAVAKAESDFHPGEVSSAGARGLMQIMPGTARELKIDPFDPAQAIDGAARMLAGSVRRYGSIPVALAAYNAGPGAVRKYGGIPPYKETQNYVQRVQKYMGEVRV